jgi:hypothetical protein
VIILKKFVGEFAQSGENGDRAISKTHHYIEKRYKY